MKGLNRYAAECYNGLRLSGLERFNYGGVRVELTLYDSESEQKRITTRTQEALADGSRLLIGGLTDAEARRMASLAQQEAPELALLTPAAASYDLTVEYDNVVRMPYHHVRQASLTAEAVAWALGDEKPSVALLYNAEDMYGLDLAYPFQRRMEELGGEIATELLFVPGEASYESLSREVVQSGANAVYLPALPDEAAPILQAARGAWNEIRVFGSDAWHNAELLDQAGAASFGDLEVYVPSHFFPDNERASRFAERYATQFGDPPGPLAALGYDTGQLIRQALVHAVDAADGVPTPREIRTALYAPRHVHGASGTFRVDAESRSSDRRPQFARITADGFRFHARMSAAVADEDTTTVLGHVRKLERAQDGKIVATVAFPAGVEWAATDHWHVHDGDGHVIAHVEFDAARAPQASAEEVHVSGRVEATEGAREIRDGDRVSNRGRLAPLQPR